MRRVTPFGLVIFDCDGVLVDSELITNRVYVKLLNELGVGVTLEDLFDKFVGRSMDHCWGLVAELMGRPVPSEVVEEYRARTTAALEDQLLPVRGIGEVLDVLDRQRLPYCVASSGTHEKMQTTLGITGLLPRLQGRLFSVTEVALAKPAPDVYLHAARTLGVPPSACCVIEDSPTGTTAGIAAGMTVFGYCALTPPQRLTAAGAHATFARMDELPALLSLQPQPSRPLPLHRP